MYFFAQLTPVSALRRNGSTVFLLASLTTDWENCDVFSAIYGEKRDDGSVSLTGLKKEVFHIDNLREKLDPSSILDLSVYSNKFSIPYKYFWDEAEIKENN
ncbi:MAG: hypothetical protein [Caudoviricetes sp.]|nr:MAG: hypothetical protein [Caudoviricetes sp.]